MTIQRPISLLAGCALLAACASSGSASSQSAPAPQVSPTAAVVSAQPVAAAPMPTSSPTGELSCASFDMAAAHLLTYAHYAALNVGTNNDTVATFGDMNEAMGVLTAMAPECAADAVDAIAQLGAAAGEAAATYGPGDDAAVKAADIAVLQALKDKGVVAWQAMGKDQAAWDTTIRIVD